MSSSTEVQQDTRFFGHPRGLANLFGVEMWERFSYYGMQGILAIYLYYQASQGGLGIDQSAAVGIVGAYGGTVYLSTVVGAWIADRLLGSERTLFYSAIIVMIGHIALAVLPGMAGVGVGLACVALGSGGLKGNATSVVGTLYAEGDERRDAGFTIFYMGVNLGGFIGPLLTGLAQQNLGFHFGFGLAAIGMALGLIQYTLGRKNLGEKASEVPNPLPSSQRMVPIVVAVVLVAAIVVLITSGVITAENLADVVIYIVVVISVGYFVVILTSKKITADERSRVFSFIPMYLASAAFFSLYQQQSTVVAIYSDQRLDRNLFGWEMPVSWVNSINPVFVIVFAPIVAAIWTKLGPRQPSTPMKFVFGTVLMGLAFLLFLPMTGTGENGSPLIALAGILFVFTAGELMLSPVGLSLSTKLAPEKFRTQMVALNFLSVSLGTALSGKLAESYDVHNETPYFSIIGGVAVAVGLLLFACLPFVRKLMKGVH
ncbi:POT family proton-dependent oligopeptide transporter [Amycolatopsis sulphurea]|uniref:POT family proton-dependent oligopeptide transporter n=1 Tax=Amycolatopsis sulphurea TaxID=76022 RepID=A0A2A9FBG6_9PSEU|nr:peptide MFS transporter [Amycolatopsis sulphurea]PFG48767.1 POT family proton-dependent oligopeptide transporter [Amycolatopsis sulphurea]